jgi:hypothetical protein
LEKELAEAVILAEDYLLPQQPLSMSDTVAEIVRRSFQEKQLIPEVKHAMPYLRHTKAAYRVIGYFACQVAAANGAAMGKWVLELSACLGRERREALERAETRPLWQLLVCIELVRKSNISPADLHLMENGLEDMHEFLARNLQIDSHGQCKWKLNQLLRRFASD